MLRVIRTLRVVWPCRRVIWPRRHGTGVVAREVRDPRSLGRRHRGAPWPRVCNTAPVPHVRVGVGVELLAAVGQVFGPDKQRKFSKISALMHLIYKGQYIE